MSDNTLSLLASLESMLTGAKGVPMSASCMVNRPEALALVDQAKRALAEDMAEAARVAAASLETIQRAQDEAAQIIKAAEDKAEFLVGQSQVVELARQRAADMEASAAQEAEALQREIDRFVDQRIALFEANLQKTQTQIATMRAHLARRSRLDETDTQALPRLAH